MLPSCLCRSFAATILTMLVVGSGPVSANDPQWDHDDALAAVERGEVKPLSEIMAVTRSTTSDRFVDVELARKTGRWIYEMTLLTDAGRFRVLKIDGATASILNEEFR